MTLTPVILGLLTLPLNMAVPTGVVPPAGGAVHVKLLAVLQLLVGTVTPVDGFPVGTPPAPYNQTSGSYFQAPTHTGTRNRRILNLVIVDCTNPPVGSASCGVMPVVGVGKFFQQIPAVFTGGPSNRHLMVEFAGLIQPVPIAEIKLYR